MEWFNRLTMDSLHWIHNEYGRLRNVNIWVVTNWNVNLFEYLVEIVNN